MTRLIDADVIDPRYVPIAPVITGSCTHYEWVVFAEDLEKMPTVEAIPIDFIVEFKEDYCNAKSEKCDIGIANALVELMLCWEDEQEGLEWRNDHERIPSKQQSVEAIPIEYICPRIETLNKYISKWGGSFEHEEMVNAYIHEVSALVRLIEDWRKEE